MSRAGDDMPTNALAPPDMPWLAVRSPMGQPNGLGPPLLNYAAPPDPTAPTLGQGVAQTGANAWQWLQDQRAESVRQGLLDPDTGLPTQKGLVDAARATAEGVMMGTTAPGIRAYHGSPHDFERFDTSKIGTGEGAQAYGHGLYMAGNEAVAQSYKGAGPAANAQLDAINTQLSQLAKQMDQYGTGQYGKYNDPKGYELKAQYDALMDQRTKLGHMYEVNIGADPEHFLDWDKPLSEQHPVVQQALNNTPYPPHDMSMSVRQHMAELETNREGTTRTGDPAALAAQALRDAGIPGIRYLDQGSRGAGQGSHNYVVFDENTISILKKYGLAGLMLGGGAAAAGSQQQPPSQ